MRDEGAHGAFPRASTRLARAGSRPTLKIFRALTGLAGRGESPCAARDTTMTRALTHRTPRVSSRFNRSSKRPRGSCT